MISSASSRLLRAMYVRSVCFSSSPTESMKLQESMNQKQRCIKLSETILPFSSRDPCYQNLCPRSGKKRTIREKNIHHVGESGGTGLSSNTIEWKLAANMITLMWVPGYEGIAGNGAADSLAKKGSQSVFYGCKSFCVVPQCYLREIIRLWERKQKSLHWKTVTGHPRAK